MEPGKGRLVDRLAAMDDPAARLLFEADGAARVVIERSGRILRAGDRVLLLLPGAARSGNSASAADLFVTDGRAAAWAKIEEAMASSRPAIDVAVRCGAGQGGAIDIAMSVLPVIEADRSVSGAVLVLTDATARRAAEAESLQARNLRAVGELAGGVAHDFNNLLQASLGAAEAMAARGGLTGDDRDDLRRIEAACRRGAGLVRQLLAVGRQQTLLPRLVAVNPAVSDMAGLMLRSLREGVRMELALEAPGRWVFVDPGQLDQVLMNLILNARDAMPQGGVITVRSGHRSVLAAQIGATLSGVAEAIPPGRYVTIDVADTGTGIEPALLERMFEPFFSTKGAVGTGLGLASVLGIVRQSGGFVQVETAPGVGTTMRVLLPRAHPELLGPGGDLSAIAVPSAVGRATTVPGAGTVASAVHALAGRGTILLVDDEEPVRRVAARALSRAGWTVLEADDADSALALLDDAAPGLSALVSDVVMPGLDGPALADAVRQRLSNPALPVVLVSGYAEATLRRSVAAAGAVFLAKPYGMKALAQAVDAAVSRGCAMVSKA